MTLSVVLAVFNEEKNITDCLKSVAFADEIVVVDGSSADATVRLARKYTDKVFVRKNEVNMKINNQFGFEQATGDWILLLDADERVTPELQDEILAAMSGKSFNGYYMPRRNNILGRWMLHGGNYPDYQLRLFRRGKGRLEGKHVHEKILLDGEAGFLKSDLIHYTISDTKVLFEKIDAYSDDLSAYQFEKNAYDFSVLNYLKYFAVRPSFKFFRAYVLQRGFLDGSEGLVYAVAAGVSEFISAAKYWDLKRRGGRS